MEMGIQTLDRGYPGLPSSVGPPKLVNSTVHDQGEPPKSPPLPAPNTTSLPAPGPSDQTSRSRPGYASQFPTTNSLILNLMRSSSKKSIGIFPSPANASAASRSGENAHDDAGKSTTLEMPLLDQQASQPPPNLSSHRAEVSEWRLNPSSKRKRDPDAEEVDFTQNTMAFPAPAPANSLPRPLDSSRDQIATAAGARRCRQCQREDDSLQNPVLQCSRCSRFWHKLCVPPTHPPDSMTASRFICTDCSQVDKDPAAPQSSPGAQRQRYIDRMRDKRLSELPKSVVPPKSELVGFRGGAASGLAVWIESPLSSKSNNVLTDLLQRTEYFYGKKKTELLNLLSFCDQLKPQLLVDLLVSVSRKHPDLPLFDAPDWATQVSSASKARFGPAAARPRVHQRPRHGHIITTKPRQRGKTARRPVKKEPLSGAEADEEEEEEARYEEEDIMPPTWRKAGEGLYARLVPEVQDRLFLADHNDEEAFSHFMVDKLGRQIVDPAQG